MSLRTYRDKLDNFHKILDYGSCSVSSSKDAGIRAVTLKEM